MKRSRHLTFALRLCSLFAFLGACAEEKPRTTGVSSVWAAEKDDHRIYLAGTIHLLREKDYPLPDVFEQAYRDCTRVVFELPPGSEGSGEVILRMRQLGSYPEGDSLDAHLEPETMKRVKAWADKMDFPPAVINRTRPWFLALTIAAVEYQALGAAPDRGLDHVFEKRATAEKKPAEGLETVEYQLTLFSRLSDKMQEQLLLQTLSEVDTMQKDFEAMIAAWRTGDTEKLQELLYRDADKFPDLMEEFLAKRNKAWVAPLMAHLEKGERIMVLVGAGHLGGKGGVLELLKEKGCTIRQLGK